MKDEKPETVIVTYSKFSWANVVVEWRRWMRDRAALKLRRHFDYVNDRRRS